MAEILRFPLEANQWNPESAGVNFSERVAKKLGELAVETETELFTAWIRLTADSAGEEMVFQLTQDNCRVFLSLVDDDADCIAVFDPRDGKWFNFFRETTGDEAFTQCLQTVMPWSVICHSMIPMPEVYDHYIKTNVTDTEIEGIPDDWA